MLKSSLCGYCDGYILVKETISVINTTKASKAANNKDIKLKSKLRTNSKSSGSLWQYCRDEPALNNGNIADLNASSAISDLFKIV